MEYGQCSVWVHLVFLVSILEFFRSGILVKNIYGFETRQQRFPMINDVICSRSHNEIDNVKIVLVKAKPGLLHKKWNIFINTSNGYDTSEVLF